MNNENKNYCVYMHVNKINGKRYIGITQQMPEERWRNGQGYKTQIFYRAIQKYGWDNFEHKILFDGLTKEKAEQKEIELISFYKSDNKKFGYNVSHGGNCSGTMSDETKQKLSKANKGRIISEETKRKMRENNAKPMLGKHHTAASKLKISKANMGRHHTEETKQKLSQIFKGRKLTPEWLEHRTKAQTGLKRSKATIDKIRKAESVKVICINDRKIYESLTIASNKTGVSISHISQCCNKHRNSAGRDKYNNPMGWMFYDEYLSVNGENKTYDELMPVSMKGKIGKRVICLSTNEIYDTIKDASEAKHISEFNLSKCCHHKRNWAGKNDNGEKLSWMFYDEYLNMQSGDICV